MTAQEFDNLKLGQRVTAFNGPYTQHGIVDGKGRDAKGMRWVDYHWTDSKGQKKHASKRYVSVEVA